MGSAVSVLGPANTAPWNIDTTAIRRDTSQPSRLDLAYWLIDSNHPLTSRVAVNRIWQILFGEGLVKTPYDFGSQGSFPSLPQLLDWLACEYSQNHWDTKALIKTIVMSATYQQSSTVSPEQWARDPKNRWLGRGARYRLPGEFIRDGTLSIAEVAAHTALSVAEAKDGIEALTRQGIASVEFNETDDVFYRFPGLDESEP